MVEAADGDANWTGYPAMVSMLDMVEFRGDIYGITTSGMFRFSPSSGEYRLYYKSHGLPADNILTIGASPEELFVGFQRDGLMRFDPETELFDPILFPEYVNKDDVLKTLAIYDIVAMNDSILYVAHSKGLDRLNLNTEELRSCSRLSSEIPEGTPVTRTAVFDGAVWACTPEGLSWADIDNPNLEFPENWDFVEFSMGATCVIHYLTDTEDKIFVGTNGDGIFSLSKRTKLTTRFTRSESVYEFAMANNTCYAATSQGLREKNINIWYLLDDSVKPLKALVVESEQKMWVASGSDGLQCYVFYGYIPVSRINGPRTSAFWDIDIAPDHAVWGATSWRDIGGYVHRFRDDTWVSFGVQDGIPGSVYSDKTNTTALYAAPDGLVWNASWVNGLYVHDDRGTQNSNDDVITVVDPDREIFELIGTYVVCSDVTGDRNGNIWVAGWNKGAYVMEGSLPATSYKYHHFTFDGSGTLHYVRNVHVSDDGWVWLGTWDTGVIALYVGDDPYDTSDDHVSYLTLSQGLLSLKIEAIHTDKEGSVWVATDGGLNRIRKGSNFSLEVDDMNRVFGGEAVEVNCIENDRFDNLWLGTTQGLVKLNQSREPETIYTTENSGIYYQQRILSLKYDDFLDILWAGTDTGLYSFDAAKSGSDTAVSHVHVYPNPFEIWGFNSRVVFTHLKHASPVRIYTFNGELLYEIIPGESETEASWDGRNFKGEYVGSGIYYFSGTDNGGGLFKEKLAVIRR